MSAFGLEPTMQDMTETVLLFLLKADLQVLSIFVVFSIEI